MNHWKYITESIKLIIFKPEIKISFYSYWLVMYNKTVNEQNKYVRFLLSLTDAPSFLKQF